MGKSMRVVAIDDDADDLEFLNRAASRITDLDIELISFVVPEDGVRYALAEHVDVLLVDYGLGRTNGSEVLKDVLQKKIDLPVIIMTGTDSTELAVDLLQRGATDFLPKSRLSEQSLRRSLVNALERAKLQRQIRLHQEEVERKNVELGAKNDEISRFYHHISHELKTPLTAAREFVAIVLDGLAGEITEQQREYLEISKGSCDELVRHLNDLLDVTRLDTGKLLLRLADHDLSEIVALAVRTLRPTAVQNDIDLAVIVPKDASTAFVDASRVRQIVTNLVGNAIKFTDPGGRIVVRLEAIEDRWSISVSDTGRGIPTEHREHIFERLYQVADADGFVGGMGIGLNLCREIVLLHGGTIDVESKVGEGSCFVVSLPHESPTLARTGVA